MTDKKVRCIHRHDIEHHPNCFKMGRILQVESEEMKKRVRTEAKPVGPYKRVVVAKEPWYQQPGTRVGYFDIETSNFEANAGYMVSYAIKEKGEDGKIFYDELDQKELLDGTFDLRLIKSLLEAFQYFDVIVTYYGTGFDIPFIRTRAEYWYRKLREDKRVLLDKKPVLVLKRELNKVLPDGMSAPSKIRKNDLIDLILDRDDELLSLEFPVLGELYHWDLYYVIRGKFKFNRNSLGNATEFFGIEGKTHLKPWEWNLVRLADPSIMPIIKEHNIEDVKILEKLHEIVNPYKKWTRKPL